LPGVGPGGASEGIQGHKGLGWSWLDSFEVLLNFLIVQPPGSNDEARTQRSSVGGGSDPNAPPDDNVSKGIRIVAKLAAVVTTLGGLGMAVNRQSTKSWKLAFDKATRTWESPAGLIYGRGSSQGNRVKHILAHTLPDASKPAHGVFNVKGQEALKLVDEAWTTRGAAVAGDPGAFVVPMGRTVGTAGERAVRVVVRPGTSEIITAYPVVP
jgi:hypothetical protein